MMNALGKWIAFSFMSIASVAGAAEWPRWLGPDGSGISTDKIIDHWPAGGPKNLWSAKVGLGFSSLVGLNGKVYFFAMQGSDDVLTSLDAETGAVFWSRGYAETHKGEANFSVPLNPHNGLRLPEASPAIDGDRIYTYGGGGDLIARTLADGKVLWRLNVLDETGAAILTYNEASSPLVAGNLLYVQGGRDAAVAVGVDKIAGKIVWKSESGIGGYAAPVLVDVAGKPELIVFGGNTLYGFDPATGATLWKQNWPTEYDLNATTPTYHDGHLFITSGYAQGCAMFELGAGGAKLAWKGKQISSKFHPCILHNGNLHGSSGGILKCLTWPEGTSIWSSRNVNLGDGGSFVINGSQLISLSDGGVLSLVHLESAGPKVVSEIPLFKGIHIWSAPVICRGKLFVKGTDELVCFDISAK